MSEVAAKPAAKPIDNRVAPPSVLRRYGSQMGIIGVGLAMWLAFIIAAPTVFLDVDIYKAFAQTTPLFGVLALALTFVVITGEIDLSFPSIMALGTAVFCLLVKAEMPQWLALIGGFATGALCGRHASEFALYAGGTMTFLLIGMTTGWANMPPMKLLITMANSPATRATMTA